MLDGFSLAKYRFFLVPEDRLCLHPDNPGNTLRGAFSLAFKRLVCSTPRECRARCQQKQTCPYGQLFEPSPPPDAEQLRRNADIPRPFVYRPLDIEAQSRLMDPLRFDLILMGKAMAMFPYFLVTFRELGERGMGTARGRFHIRQVVQQHPLTHEGVEIYNGQDEIVRPHTLSLTYAECERKAHELAMQHIGRVTVRFHTPTCLKSEGAIVRQPAFHHLVKRVRDRINALAYFYAHQTLALDFKHFGVRAEHVRTVRMAVQWEDRSRRSWKTGHQHDMGGFIGEATYEGAIAEFLPLLLLGQYTHVGKYAVWGNGWYTVTVE